MKTIRKTLAVILTAALLCFSASTLSASAASSVPDAVGILIANDADDEDLFAVNAAMVTDGKDIYVFSPGEEINSLFQNAAGNQYRLFLPEGNMTVSVEFVQSVLDGLFNVYRMTNRVNIQAIPIRTKTSSAKEAVTLAYYDSEGSASLNSTNGTITETDGSILYIEADNVSIVTSVLNASCSEYIGIALRDDGFYCAVTAQGLLSLLDGNNTTDPQPTTQQPETTQPAAAEPEEVEEPEEDEEPEESGDDEDTTQGGSSSAGTSTATTVYTAAAILVAVGLVILILYSASKRSRTGIDGIPGAATPLPTPNGGEPDRICIRGQGGQFDGQKFVMDGSVTIGRQGGRCNICYPADAKGVSGLHCKLRKVGDRIELIDLGSTYGTFVNGKPIAPNAPVMLQVGDTFSIGGARNTFTVYR